MADLRLDRWNWIAILALRRSASRRESTSSGQAAETFRTDASWNRSFSIQWRVRTEDHVVRIDDARSVWASERYGTSSGRMEQWTYGHPDGMERSSGRLTRNRLFWLQNLLKYFWIAESLVKQHLYIQVILSKQNEANHKLTICLLFEDLSVNPLAIMRIYSRSSNRLVTCW